jgi:hypothetical protein
MPPFDFVSCVLFAFCLFDLTVGEVCGRLLYPMPTMNAMDVFKFAMMGISREPASYSDAIGLLSSIFDFTVQRDAVGQFFLNSYQDVWLGMLDLSKRSDDDICLIARIFEGLCYLHYTHDEQLMRMGIITRIVDIVVTAKGDDDGPKVVSASGKQLSQQALTGFIDVLIAVAQNPYLIPQLRGMISSKQLYALIDASDLTTMRHAFALFQALYLNLLPSVVNTPDLYKSSESIRHYQQLMKSHDAFNDFLLPVLQLCVEKYRSELKKIVQFLPEKPVSLSSSSKDAIDSGRLADHSNGSNPIVVDDIDLALAGILDHPIDPSSQIVMSALSAVTTNMGHVNAVLRMLVNTGHFATLSTHDSTAIIPSPRNSFSFPMTSVGPSVPPPQAPLGGAQVPLLESLYPSLGSLRRAVLSILVSIVGENCESIPPCLEGMVLRKLIATFGHLRGYAESCWKFRFYDEELIGHAQRVYMDVDKDEAGNDNGDEGDPDADVAKYTLQSAVGSGSTDGSLGGLMDPAMLSTSPGKTYVSDNIMNIRRRSMTDPSNPVYGANSLGSNHSSPRRYSNASDASSGSPRQLEPFGGSRQASNDSIAGVPPMDLTRSLAPKSKFQQSLEARGMHRALAAPMDKYVEGNCADLLSKWASFSVDKKFVHIALLSIINVAVGIDVLEEFLNLKLLAEKVYGVLKEHTEYGLEQQCGQLITAILIHLKNKQQSAQVMSSLTAMQPGGKLVSQQVLLKKRFVSRGRQGSLAPQVEPTTLNFVKPLCDLIISRLSSPVNAKNDSMLYVYLSMLIALCYHDCTARKIVVQNFLKIYEVFWTAMRTQALVPMLQLLMHSADSMNRIEGGATVGMASNEVAAREDCFTNLCVFALRCQYAQTYVPCMAACTVISHIGTNFPSIARRVFSKREVESCLFSLLRMSRRYVLADSSAAQSLLAKQLFPYPQLTYLALRACVVCIRLLTVKCNWDVAEYSFSLTSYCQSDISHRRPLLCEETIDILIDLSSKSHPSFRLLIMIACLEACTALRLNCRPADTQSQAEQEFFSALKQVMVNRVIVLLPRALAILIHKRNIITVNIRMPRTKDKSLGVNDFSDYTNTRSGSSDGPTEAGATMHQREGSPRYPVANRFPRLRNLLNRNSPPPEKSSPRGSPAVSPAKSSPRDKKSKEVKQALKGAAACATPERPDNYHVNVASEGARTVSVDGAYGTFDEDPVINPLLEQLTETAVEAMYAFFCIDDPIPMPMVTFASNSHLFSETPIYYMLEYSMLCFPDNHLIQNRGVEIFQTFAENNINLYSLTIHASIVLMIAFETFQESSEMYIAFSKLVLCIVSHSESIREKLVRYGVQDGLSRVLLGFSVDAAVMALQALQMLCLNEEEALAVMEGNSNIFAYVLRALDHFTTDHRVQVEGLRFVLAITSTPEYHERANFPQTLAVLKKSRKVLLQVLDQRSLAPGYRYADVQAILKNELLPRADGEKCVIC